MVTDKSPSIKPRVLTLMGPTASGKSALALALAEALPIELISVDSIMVYRGMDIGTAKPTPDELLAVPHHLIDIRQPEQSYSAADFCADATHAIEAVHARGKLPCLVGGTMLYFRSLLQGLSPLPAADPDIRAQLAQRQQHEGLAALHAELVRVDPEAAKHIHPHDPQRIQRALEVYLISGQPMSAFHGQRNLLEETYEVLQLALVPSCRAWLHERIATRLAVMFEAGFIEEVRRLSQHPGLTPEHSALRSVGYRQVYDYLQGGFDFKQMQQRATAATRQLAKRQLTWLRSWPNIVSFDCTNTDLIVKVLTYLKQAWYT